jgi:hypothetical protein
MLTDTETMKVSSWRRRIEQFIDSFRNVGKGLALVLVVASVVSYVISLALGPILFFSTSDGLSVAARQIHQLPVDFFMIITVPIPVGINLGGLFGGVWAIFLICFVFAWLSRGGFPKSVRNLFSTSISMSNTSFLFFMPLLASALLYATVLIQQFQATQGVQTGSLNFPQNTPQYLIFLELAFAPLREEFGFRITSIGIPVGVFLLIRYRSDAALPSVMSRIKLLLLAMVSPENAKVKLGYRNVTTKGLLRGISPLEWALILITAVSFGSAHYLLGGGWEIGKVTTASLAGFVFGVVYVAYGAYAPILMHWYFNYYFTVLGMADSVYGGVFQSNLVEFVNLAAGQILVVVFLIYVALRISGSLTQTVARLGYPRG